MPAACVIFSYKILYIHTLKPFKNIFTDALTVQGRKLQIFDNFLLF
jgi:hypothetical protein